MHRHQPMTAEALTAAFRADLRRDRRRATVRRWSRAIKAGAVVGILVGLGTTTVVRTMTEADLTPRNDLGYVSLTSPDAWTCTLLPAETHRAACRAF